MRAQLGHISLAQNNDDVRVVYCAKSMGYEDGGAFLFFDEGVDVREEGGFGVSV
jgi:hypothetical protein